MVDLWYRDAGHHQLDRAISALRAVADDDRSARALSDLSAALLVRHGRSPSLRDIIEAVHLAKQAIDTDSAFAPAHYNHALGITMLGARWAALSAWQSYAAVSGQPAPHVELHDDPWMLSPKAVAAAGRWRESTREYAWRTIAPRWAEGVLARDSSAVTSALIDLDMLGHNADDDPQESAAALRRILATIRGPGRAERVARASLAQHLLATARERSSWSLADSVLGTVEVRGLPTAVEERLEEQSALVALSRGWLQEGRVRLQRLRATTASPALRRRATLSLAISESVLGRSMASADALRSVGQECGAAGDETCALAATSFSAMLRQRLGDTRAVEDALLRVIPLAARAPLSSRQWSSVRAIRDAAASQGAVHAADVLDQELTNIATRLDRVDLRLASLRANAVDLARRGEWPRFETVARDFLLVWQREAPGGIKASFADDAGFLEAEVLRRTNPQVAQRMLDTAIATALRAGNPLRALPMRVSRARVWLDRGDTVEAVTELRHVLMLGRRQVSNEAVAADRIALEISVRHVSELLATVLLEHGNARGALAALSGDVFVEGAAPAAHDVPVGEASIAVRELGDSIVVFSQRDTTLLWYVTKMRRGSLARLLERTDSTTLVRLHLELFGSGARPLDGVSRLYVDVRGTASAIPWAALRDPVSGRYLIEAVTPIQVSSLLTVSFDRPVQSRPSVLVLDAAPRQGRGALDGGAREAGDVAAIWGKGARVVRSSTVSNRLGRELKRATVLHFAGHAVASPDDPERGALLLSGVPVDSLLDVAEVRGLP
ncbi:MAG: CHAT domain-containing protein, partial [Gemmatimonadaceae bacterium]|nr:CHAT domain-containing protein [Gemmatimonadaceae bacterium]